MRPKDQEFETSLDCTAVLGCVNLPLLLLSYLLIRTVANPYAGIMVYTSLLFPKTKNNVVCMGVGVREREREGGKGERECVCVCVCKFNASRGISSPGAGITGSYEQCDELRCSARTAQTPDH